MSFDAYPLSPLLQPTLKQLGFITPTPIQAATIPLALQGRDVLGSADTGTGKTLAYALPAVHALLENEEGTALIVAPTRELAEQVMNVLMSLISKHKHLRSALLIGGTPIWKQFSRLQRDPRLIVGTPGRINDHLQRGSLSLAQTRLLVIDEADRMLDMGFGVQLDAILEHMPEERQTLMFSATFPSNIKALSKRFLRDPERIEVGSNSQKTNVNLVQEVVFIHEDAKFGRLADELQKRDGSILIFASTKMKTEKLAQRLSASDLPAQAMHGDLRQSQRQRVLSAFREQRFRILVATDVAGRGLDVPHIQHVINYDMPQSPEDYTHRIGRTARNGAAGFSFCMVSRQDQPKWNAIQRLKQGKETPVPRPSRGGKWTDKFERGFKKFGDSSERPRSFKKSDRFESRSESGNDRPRSFKKFDKFESREERGSERPRSFQKSDRFESRNERGSERPRSFKKPDRFESRNERGSERPRSFQKSDRFESRNERGSERPRSFQKPDRFESRNERGSDRPRSFKKSDRFESRDDRSSDRPRSFKKSDRFESRSERGNDRPRGKFSDSNSRGRGKPASAASKPKKRTSERRHYVVKEGRAQDVVISQ